MQEKKSAAKTHFLKMRDNRVLSAKSNLLVIILTMALVLSSGCASLTKKGQVAQKEQTTQTEQMTAIDKNEFSKSYPVTWDSDTSLEKGNILLGCDSAKVLQDFDYGDMIDVIFPGKDAVRLPVCGDYDDVSPGQPLLRMKRTNDKAILAVNYGHFGVEMGYLEPVSGDAENNYKTIGDDLPNEVTFKLVEKGAYSDRLRIGALQLSIDRDAYPDLSDEEFCNFRNIAFGDIGANKLYRSSSPIDDTIGRNKYADALLEKNSIKTIINLVDSDETVTEYPGYDDSNYTKADAKFIELNLSFGTKDFNDGIAEGLRCIANNEGPYLFHCLYGKDRTGVMSGITEALMGASMEEVVNDYVRTYDNLYDVQDGKQLLLDDDLHKMLGDNFIDILSYAYGVDINAENINEETERYVRSIGLTEEEIAKIRKNLQYKTRIGGGDGSQETENRPCLTSHKKVSLLYHRG